MAAPALPPALRLRAEWMGLGFAILCLGPAFFPQAFSGLLPDGLSGLAVPIVVASMLAGMFAALGADTKQAPESVGVVPRLGIRAALITTLLGSGLTVFAITIHAFASPFASFVIGRVILTTLLGIPPSLFFGMLAAVIVTMITTPPAERLPSPSQVQPGAAPRSGLFSAALLCSVLGYLSPLLLYFKPSPKPVVFALPAPTPAPPKIETRPPPPPWHYEKPAGFDKADASLRVIVDTKTIGEVATDAPIALSPDGSALAYCPKSNGGKTVVVTEFNSLKERARLTLAEPVDYFAWDPGSHRLFYSPAGGRRTVGVLDIDRAANIPLPIPSGAGVSVGRVAWWTDKEVAFFVPGRQDQSLNLDTLRLRELASVSDWTVLPETRRKAIFSTDAPALPASSAGTMQFALRIGGYQVPEGSRPEAAWAAKGLLCMEWTDGRTATGHFVEEIDLETNDRLLTPADGSKLVRIHNGNITVFYFGLGRVSFPRWKMKMPATHEKVMSAPVLAELFQDMGLCAFVCAPILNPLNGKPVGPDRERIRGVVRFKSWQDQDAEVWLAQSHAPVQSGDLITDLHVWRAGELIGVGDFGDGTWWTPVPAETADFPLPSPAQAPPLEIPVATEFALQNGAIRFQGLDQNKFRLQPEPAVPSVRNDPQPQRPATAEPDFAQSAVAQALRKFIAEHHAKSSRGDVDGLIADYDDKVDHLGHGLVDREYVRKDEIASRKPGSAVTETVIIPPKVGRLTTNLYTAFYSINFHQVLANGRWAKGISDIDLRIQITPAGPRITSQSAKTRDLQRGP